VSGPRPRIESGDLAAAVDRRLRQWRDEQLRRRLWSRDPTIWSAEPRPELADRLGWLGLPAEMPARVAELESFAATVAADGFAEIVLLGMGGSSLAPEVFQRCFGNRSDRPRLRVLDSTHPDMVRRVGDEITPERTLFVVSSKSGTTIETLSLLRHFWRRLAEAVEHPGRHFAAITDPGSALAEWARDRDFRGLFLAPTDVGGRYSALTVFGLLPAALIGVDIGELLRRAREMAADSALGLGALLGEAALAGRDKLILVTSPELAAFPDWIEQLVAESTGKDGRGIVPVVDETLSAGELARPGRVTADSVVVAVGLESADGRAEMESALDAVGAAGHPVARLDLRDRLDLGAEILRWEVATATAGAVLGIQPFDQPDVQVAKRLAQEAMRGETSRQGGPAIPTVRVAPTDPQGPETPLGDALRAWLAARREGDFLAVQAYVDRSPEHLRELQALCRRLRAASGLPTTLGFGPRFLHSTGQLHKGGANTGLFLQLIDRPGSDLPVPATDFTFGELIGAQADGDARALLGRDRRLLRVDLGAGDAAGLAAVTAELS